MKNLISLVIYVPILSGINPQSWFLIICGFGVSALTIEIGETFGITNGSELSVDKVKKFCWLFIMSLLFVLCVRDKKKIENCSLKTYLPIFILEDLSLCGV